MNKLILILSLLAVFFTFNLGAASSSGQLLIGTSDENSPLNIQILSSQKVDPLVLKKLETSNETSVLVALKNDSFKNLKEKKVMVKNKQGRVLAPLTENDFKLEVQYKTIYFLAGNITLAGIRKLENDPDVDVIIDASGMGEVALAESVPLVGGLGARDLGYDASGQTICVIDSGVDYTNPELGGCFGPGCRVIAGYDYVNDDSDPLDDYGHGTWVTGILVSSSETLGGLAPGANIAALKVLGSGGDGQWTWIAAGVDWCVNNKDTYNISVISMSIGSFDRAYDSPACIDTSGSSAVASAIDTAVAGGLFVSVASGNYGNTTGISFPACRGNAVSVGATYDADVGSLAVTTCTDDTTAADKMVCFTNRNDLLDLVAPGALIKAQHLGGSYLNGAGTSASAPHVSGAAAILRQIKPDITPLNIRDALKNTGTDVYDPATGLTFPRLDVLNATTYVLPPLQSNWTPANGSIINSGSPTIAFDANEDAWCRWSLYDLGYSDMPGSNDCYGGGTTSLSCSTFGLSEGPVTVHIACMDTQGHGDTVDTNTHLDYNVNIAPPDVTTYSPQNSTYTTGSIDLNYTVYDTGEIDWIGYSLDGQTNVTISGEVANFSNSAGGDLGAATNITFDSAGSNTSVYIEIPGDATVTFARMDVGSRYLRPPAQPSNDSAPPVTPTLLDLNLLNLDGTNIDTTLLLLIGYTDGDGFSRSINSVGNAGDGSGDTIFWDIYLTKSNLYSELSAKNETNITMTIDGYEPLTVTAATGGSVTGDYYLSRIYPSNLTIDTANDTIIDWSMTVGPNSINALQSVDLNVTAINNYLDTCGGEGSCRVPLNISMGLAGIVQLDALSVKYYSNATLASLSNGVHTITVYANDTAGNTALAAVSFTTAQATYDTPLSQGWNLVSIPLEQDNWSVEAVLASIDGNYTAVYAYIDGIWKFTTARNPLTDMDLEHGYWIEMTVPDTLELTGTIPLATTINITTGWSLVGYPSFTTKNITDVLAGINYTAVYAYIDGVWKFTTARNPLTEMTTGYGYWIDSNEAKSYEVRN